MQFRLNVSAIVIVSLVAYSFGALSRLRKFSFEEATLYTTDQSATIRGETGQIVRNSNAILKLEEQTKEKTFLHLLSNGTTGFGILFSAIQSSESYRISYITGGHTKIIMDKCVLIYLCSKTNHEPTKLTDDAWNFFINCFSTEMKPTYVDIKKAISRVLAAKGFVRNYSKQFDLIVVSISPSWLIPKVSKYLRSSLANAYTLVHQPNPVLETLLAIENFEQLHEWIEAILTNPHLESLIEKDALFINLTKTKEFPQYWVRKLVVIRRLFEGLQQLVDSVGCFVKVERLTKLAARLIHKFLVRLAADENYNQLLRLSKISRELLEIAFVNSYSMTKPTLSRQKSSIVILEEEIQATLGSDKPIFLPLYETRSALLFSLRLLKTWEEIFLWLLELTKLKTTQAQLQNDELYQQLMVIDGSQSKPVDVIVIMVRFLEALQFILYLYDFPVVHPIRNIRTHSSSPLEAFIFSGFLYQLMLEGQTSRVCFLETVVRVAIYDILKDFPLLKLKVNPYSPLISQSCDLRRLQWKKKLGTGAHGKVYLVQDKKDLTFHALKVISKKAAFGSAFVEEVEREVKCLSRINNQLYTNFNYGQPHAFSPFIVQAEGFFQGSCFGYIIMEYLPGKNLDAFYALLHYSEKYSFDEIERAAKFHAVQILLGIEDIHSIGIVHRDINPNNIMLDALGNIRIIDFSLARIIRDKKIKERFGGYRYLPPEAMEPPFLEDNRVAYGTEIDFYMFGATLYEMVTGKPLYGDYTSKELTILEVSDLEISTNMGANMQDLLQKLLCIDRNHRLMDLTEIKKHPWFAEVKWEEYRARLVQSPIALEISASHFLQLEGLNMVPSDIPACHCKYMQHSDFFHFS